MPETDWVCRDNTLNMSLYYGDCLHLVKKGNEKLALSITSAIKINASRINVCTSEHNCKKMNNTTKIPFIFHECDYVHQPPVSAQTEIPVRYEKRLKKKREKTVKRKTVKRKTSEPTRKKVPTTTSNTKLNNLFCDKLTQGKRKTQTKIFNFHLFFNIIFCLFFINCSISIFENIKPEFVNSTISNSKTILPVIILTFLYL